MQAIEPKYVNAVKPGKKYGSVVDVDGSKYFVPEKLVSQFAVGHRYQCEIIDQTWGDSQVKVVQRVAANSNGVANGYSPKKLDPADARRMFMCGGLFSFIKAGKVEPRSDEIMDVLRTLHVVWAQTFGKEL